MKDYKCLIGDIPLIIYGEKSDKVFIYVHGKNGCKEEAKYFSEIVVHNGYQVIIWE